MGVGGVMEFQDFQDRISIEHVSPGQNLPDWLIQHQLKLAKWNSSDGTKLSRIMIIYSNEESRKQSLKNLKNLGDMVPLDSSLHVTIPRLIDLIHSDLRLPKLIDDDGILFEIIHDNCMKTAAKAGLPRLHSNTEIPWSRGKTRMLNQLHQQLCEKNLPEDWTADPGIIEFEKILLSVEKQMLGTHPRLRIKKIINKLKENDNLELFTFREIDGIILQDMSPTLSEKKIELLQLISVLKPIHQLCNPGSFRLGEHGAYIADVPVCKSTDSLPSWIPRHELNSKLNLSSEIFHLGLFNSLQTDETIHGILSELSNSTFSKSEIIIVDSRNSNLRKKWPRLFESVGIKIDDETPDTHLSALYWLGELMKLGSGQDAWSCDKLKMILNQNSLPFNNNYLISEKHPVNEEYFPIADPKLLEEIARTYHILGGRGSLREWLYALSKEKFDNPFVDEKTQRKIREQTQWWLLSIANLIRPLLSELDRKTLAINELNIGCDSKEELPTLDLEISADDWLLEIIKKLDWESWMNITTPDNSIVGIQKYLHLHANLRKTQQACLIKAPFDGINWIEESIELMNSISLSKLTCTDENLRILSPQNSLGCSAEIVIVVGLGSDDWDLSIPSFPWLDVEQLRIAGLLNPDEKIRAARHYFNHILFSGKQILLLDPSIDSKTFPCTPFAEWLNSSNQEEGKLPVWLENYNESWEKQLINEKEIFVFKPEKIIWKNKQSFTNYTGTTSRSIKQKLGVTRLLEGKKAPLLNDAAPIIMYEKPIHHDRIKREPIGLEEEEDYLNWSERENFVSTVNLNLIRPKKFPKDSVSPRENKFWPVIGRRHNRNSSTPSIDPRPIESKHLQIKSLDERSGHSKSVSLRKNNVWSANKLNKWIQCPRKGWLESELYLSKDEIINEDLDIRIRGITLHDAFAELICSQLGFEIGEERIDFTLKNISDISLSLEELMSEFVKILSEKTPWLGRSDAMAVHRRRDFIGMTLPELDLWWENDTPPLSPKGRLGQLLISEFLLKDCINLAFEWDLNEAFIEFFSNKVPLRGWIDRVDLIPFSDGRLVNKEGNNSPAPFIFSDEWTPRRLILIRDTKSVEGPSKDRLGEKHKKAIFEDIQLALYARAWELSHPGDLVIGVGITEVGDLTNNNLEIDPDYEKLFSTLEVGEITTYTHDMFRFPNEKDLKNSNPFRAWLSWKIMVAAKASNFSEEGRVHPIPGEHCEYCSVRRICGLGLEKRGDF